MFLLVIGELWRYHPPQPYGGVGLVFDVESFDAIHHWSSARNDDVVVAE